MISIGIIPEYCQIISLAFWLMTKVRLGILALFGDFLQRQKCHFAMLTMKIQWNSHLRTTVDSWPFPPTFAITSQLKCVFWSFLFGFRCPFGFLWCLSASSSFPWRIIWRTLLPWSTKIEVRIRTKKNRGTTRKSIRINSKEFINSIKGQRLAPNRTRKWRIKLLE